MLVFFFFKQKTAYEMRISDWSSDVCSSDLLGHAGLDVAAPGAVFLAGGVEREGARRRELGGHPRQLARHPRKMADRLAELYSFGGVTKAQLEGVATDPEGARRGLDAGAPEGRHQLLEALAPATPPQGGDRKRDV